MSGGTNITAEHRRAFEALASGAHRNFALFSCFVNGEPASAIVAVTDDGEAFSITPLFVSVTPGMILTDHDGTPAGAGPRYEVQQFTLCDGWVNTWRIEHADGSSEPETFASEHEAQAALDEFLAEIEAEIASGERAPDEGYDRDEFRVVKISPEAGGSG